MFFDLFGALVSLLSTYYFIRLNNKAWLVGIIATIVNGCLYWQKGIYGDMALEIVYFSSMLYGLHKWRTVNSNNSTSDSLGNFSVKQWIGLTTVFTLVFLVIFYLLRTYTNSNVALMDATTTTLSLMAQWLMCYKIIFTWIIWGITDLFYASMYLGKNLPIHSALMLIYTIMAIIGYSSWAKKYKKLSVLSTPLNTPV
ncbi:MAG TPA: nicotinamide riboside transporter PnuC [Legionella sp.]|nr:nicotinamide riboside transporter PnuC [Legionella sp.]